jgi:hypothetical protein
LIAKAGADADWVVLEAAILGQSAREWIRRKRLPPTTYFGTPAAEISDDDSDADGGSGERNSDGSGSGDECSCGDGCGRGEGSDAGMLKKMTVTLDALPGNEVVFDLPAGRESPVAILKGVKQDEMIATKVGNGRSNGAKTAAVGKVPKKRWASLRPATVVQDPHRRQQ